MFLIHVLPQIFNTYSNVEVALVDIVSPELNLSLNPIAHVALRKPFPNKKYSVACRKIGSKAIEGLLLRAPKMITNFTITTRWCLDAERIITHTVHHHVLDCDFNFTSTNCMLWGAWHAKYPNRSPGHGTPCNFTPAMKVLYGDKDTSRESDFTDIYKDGWLVQRTERISMPTLEEARLHLLDRYPPPMHAIDCIPA